MNEATLKESHSVITASEATDDEETARWLASIVGAFDGDPFYARMIENVEENRRRTVAEYDAVGNSA
jgi:hypothetical protein